MFHNDLVNIRVMMSLRGREHILEYLAVSIEREIYNILLAFDLVKIMQTTESFHQTSR